MPSPGSESSRGSSERSNPFATPSGIPAGVVGSAETGPAFVPVTLANIQDFEKRFGAITNDRFGTVAVQQWLGSQTACTFMRVLGIGNGKERVANDDTNSDGENLPAGGVKDAGFVVGSRLTQSLAVPPAGLLVNNPFAYEGGAPGRTYFLTALMSESKGSTVLSDAGIQISNHAVPILRGVLFAASGVIPALSGSYTGNASTASAGPTSGIFAEKQDGGAAFGNAIADSSSQEFVLLLNGHVGTSEYPNTITASLNPTTVNDEGINIYISSSLNTNPLKLQDAGHYLYTHYDLRTSQAILTGSGIVTGGKDKRKPDGQTLIPCIGLVTASIPRNAADSFGSLSIPNFENFNDRFSIAKTPFIISQRYDGKQYDLFRFHALDDGIAGTSKIKITISNLVPVPDEGEYGTFDVTIRHYGNLDDNFAPVLTSEEYLGCSLNPASDNYIAKMIGDQHTYFDFDRTTERQRYVVAGNYTNYSVFVRIEMAPDVENKQLSSTVLPAGFRGPFHLVTSGSQIMSSPQYPLTDGSVVASSTAWAHRIVEPPIHYRIQIGDRSITTPIGSTVLELNPNLCWGLKVTQVEQADRPNTSTSIDAGIKSHFKYFPTFTTVRTAAAVGDNTGVSDSAGTVYDSDRFNNNLFSLENIQIHTVADTGIVDNEEWAYAKYRPNRILAPLVDSAGIVKSIDPGAAGADRFFEFSKDLSTVQPNVFTKFTIPMQGGFDGSNIFSYDKSYFLNNAAYFELNDPLQGTTAGPTITAYMKALKLIAMKSEVDIKLLALPGIRLEPIANYAISQVEEMFDAFYIMDVEERDQLNTYVTSSEQIVSPSFTSSLFRSRGLDSSFVATYFPDVSLTSPAGDKTFMPPSVHILGIMASIDQSGSPFPVAGTKRGLIQAPGAQTKVEFDRTQKATIETLYKTGINPIVSSIVYGPYVYSQRTFMTGQDSVFERINVRRMLIEIRRSVKEIAKNYLFDQNREQTLSQFQSACDPVLKRFVRRKGISRFKVKIDMSTTTQADIESNTVRGQIFLQPYKSDEIASIDFST